MNGPVWRAENSLGPPRWVRRRSPGRFTGGVGRHLHPRRPGRAAGRHVLEGQDDVVDRGGERDSGGLRGGRGSRRGGGVDRLSAAGVVTARSTRRARRPLRRLCCGRSLEHAGACHSPPGRRQVPATGKSPCWCPNSSPGRVTVATVHILRVGRFARIARRSTGRTLDLPDLPDLCHERLDRSPILLAYDRTRMWSFLSGRLSVVSSEPSPPAIGS